MTSPRPPRTPARRPDAVSPGLATRRLALQLVTAVLDDRMTLDHARERLASSRVWTSLSAQDRALTRAIATTTLRRLGQIDDALRRLMSRPLPAKAVMAKRVLQLAGAQILFMDVPAHAAVSLAVDLVDSDPIARIWKGLVNAVARNLDRERAALLAAQSESRLAVPRWLRDRWVAAYGEATVDGFTPALLADPHLDITAAAEPAAWAERLGATLLPNSSLRLIASGPVEDLPGFAQGAWWVQDAAASLPARLMGDVAGRRVADLCAAPGGKTAQLAMAGAEVTALDISAHRLMRLTENMARLRLARVTTLVADLEDWQPDAPFDAVLFDAPCSATGTIRRHPDVMRLKRKEDVAALAALQSRLLDRAHLWVRPGGTLVYCTCSLEPEEGEAQIAAFLARTDRFRRRPVTADDVAGMGELITPAGDMRALPHHLPHADPRMAGLDGFFAARLERTGN